MDVCVNAPGADLLRMNKEDLVQVCGPADGIRLFNTIRARWDTNRYR